MKMLKIAWIHRLNGDLSLHIFLWFTRVLVANNAKHFYLHFLLHSLMLQLQLYGFQISKNIGPTQVLWGISYHGSQYLSIIFHIPQLHMSCFAYQENFYIFSFFLCFNLKRERERKRLNCTPSSWPLYLQFHSPTTIINTTCNYLSIL